MFLSAGIFGVLLLREVERNVGSTVSVTTFFGKLIVGGISSGVCAKGIVSGSFTDSSLIFFLLPRVEEKAYPCL